ncbi:MAG: endonuclease/exonuclease/phosphatase family protein [Anaerolineae bacterium]|nr:endonuclease/exonuclease/phosphatase family protein [Anaerolineae bacterium]
MKLAQIRPYLFPAARFAGRLSLAGTQILVIVLLAWLALWFFPGDRWLFIRLGSYFVPWLLMILFPALLVALMGRRYWLAGFTVLLILVLGVPYVPVFTPQLPLVWAQDKPGELRVMTFNVNYTNRNATDIADLIRAEKPDIIAFQEITGPLQASLLPELAPDYPYYLVNDWGLPLVLVSRYPLLKHADLIEAPHAQLATAATPYGAVAIWNVHPCPAVRQTGWEAQRQALVAIAAAIEKETGPLIVLGDFNTTDRAENYYLMADRMTDVHHAVGRGFGFTYPEPDVLARLPFYTKPLELISPVVRIDHVFVSKHFTSQETHVVPGGYGSDHRPVVATLGFKS